MSAWGPPGGTQFKESLDPVIAKFSTVDGRHGIRSILWSFSEAMEVHFAPLSNPLLNIFESRHLLGFASTLKTAAACTQLTG